MVYPDLLIPGLYPISYRIYPIDYREYNEKEHNCQGMKATNWKLPLTEKKGWKNNSE
jgi:hypothetical protein